MPSPAPRVEHRPDPTPGAFAWIAWAALLVSAALFVARFGPRVPIWDDFAVVPALSGHQPVTLSWLWSQHSEHRFFLPRLALLGSYRASGYDFRAPMALNVAGMAALAALVLLGLRAARGRWRDSDALYPLLLLGPAHAENFIWGVAVSFVLPTALAGAALMLAVRRPGLPGPGRGLAIGAALAALPLCNAAGVALAPAPALWLLGAGLARARRDRARGLSVAASALPALVLSVLYFRGYERTTYHPLPPGIAEVIRTTLQFLGMALGPAAIELDPWAGRALGVLFALAALASARAALVAPGERARALAVLAALGGAATLALGTGWGRAGLGTVGGQQIRYATLAAFPVLAAAVAFELHGPGPSRRLVPLGLLVALCVAAWPDAEAGLAIGRERLAKSSAFLADLRSRVPPYLLVRRHTPFLHPRHDELAERLGQLRAARIPPFDRMAPDPPFREEPVPLDPDPLQLAEWDGRTLRAVGVDPQAVFRLPGPPRYVAGVRIRYSHANPEGEPARFKLAWAREGDGGFSPEREYASWAQPTGPGRSVTVWVGEPIDRLRLQPDNRPCTFTIDEMTLLVPER